MSYTLLTFPISENTWPSWVANHPNPIIEFAGGQNACAIAAALFSGLIEEERAIVALYDQYLNGNPGVLTTDMEAGISLITDNIFNLQTHAGESIEGAIMRLKHLLPDNTATIIIYRHTGQGPISIHVNILGKLNGQLVVYEPNLNIMYYGDNDVVQYYTNEQVLALATLFAKPEKNLKTAMSDTSKGRDLRSRRIAEVGDTAAIMNVETEEDINEESRGVKRMIIKNRAQEYRDIKQKKLGGNNRKIKTKKTKTKKNRKTRKNKKIKFQKKNKKSIKIKRNKTNKKTKQIKKQNK